MSEILKKEIILTELGKHITTTLLLTNPSPYIIVFVLYMQENNAFATVSDLFERYIVNNIGNSMGNVNYLSYVINCGVENGLFEFRN